MSENPNSSKVFMALDITKNSFSSSTRGEDTVAYLIVIGFTAIYWIFNFSMMNIYMMLMDTVKMSKPLMICIIVYILIMQKIVRKFIFKEKEMLESFMKQNSDKVYTLSKYYDIKSSGYERHEKGNFHKVIRKNGTEEYVIKFSRGSITQESFNAENIQIGATYKFLNTVMRNGMLPVVLLSDERSERSSTFKFFQQCLKSESFDPEFVELCNSTLLYHQQIMELYSRVPANYYIVPASTSKQKLFLDNFVLTLSNYIKNTPFTEARALTKLEILNLYKDLNAITQINETELQTDEATVKVPLGDSKVLSVATIGGATTVINKPTESFNVSLRGLNVENLQQSSKNNVQSSTKEKNKQPSSNKNLLNQIDASDFEPLAEINLEEEVIEEVNQDKSTIEVKDLEKILNPNLELETQLDIEYNKDELDFSELPEELTEIEKTVLLMKKIQGEDCELIKL